jgi:hypothetical protein
VVTHRTVLIALHFCKILKNSPHPHAHVHFARSLRAAPYTKLLHSSPAVQCDCIAWRPLAFVDAVGLWPVGLWLLHVECRALCCRGDGITFRLWGAALAAPHTRSHSPSGHPLTCSSPTSTCTAPTRARTPNSHPTLGFAVVDRALYHKDHGNEVLKKAKKEKNKRVNVQEFHKVLKM